MTSNEDQNQKANQLIHKFTYEELTLNDIDGVLSKTIFEDTEAKRILFLASTLTFTNDHQKNVILTGASSTGKTYNIKEILWFFQNADQNKTIIAINDATPRSLIYSPNAITVDERTLEPIDFSKQPKKGDPKELWDEWYDLKRPSN
jgi:type IV secretory pathway ATPase VirB11/archaellum biosynthesis ATPase